MVEPIYTAFRKKINKVYKGMKIGSDGLKGRVEIDPELAGWFAWDIHSMSSQCAKLGVPTLQLELGPDFRFHLVNNDFMIHQWAKAIVEIYNEVVVANWSKFITPITVNP